MQLDVDKCKVIIMGGKWKESGKQQEHIKGGTAREEARGTAKILQADPDNPGWNGTKCPQPLLYLSKGARGAAEVSHADSQPMA